jgi:hypothetical protein
MALFDDVFNAKGVYETLFFNVKAVLIHPTLEELEANNKPLYEQWLYIRATKYKSVVHVPNELYQQYAVLYPEYTRIVAISYATLYLENGSQKRFFKQISNDDEYVVIATFMDTLYELSKAGVQSNPQYFPILCGYNIISYDIPLLIKRFLLHKEKFGDKQLPYMLKRSLNIKPWESGLVDVVNVWKFNGFDNAQLMLISEYLGLKKTVDLLPHAELSKYYWDNIEKNPVDTLKYFSLQSATQTNLVIQLMNRLREL